MQTKGIFLPISLICFLLYQNHNLLDEYYQILISFKRKCFFKCLLAIAIDEVPIKMHRIFPVADQFFMNQKLKNTQQTEAHARRLGAHNAVSVSITQPSRCLFCADNSNRKFMAFSNLSQSQTYFCRTDVIICSHYQQNPQQRGFR